MLSGGRGHLRWTLQPPGRRLSGENWRVGVLREERDNEKNRSAYPDQSTADPSSRSYYFTFLLLNASSFGYAEQGKGAWNSSHRKHQREQMLSVERRGLTDVSAWPGKMQNEIPWNRFSDTSSTGTQSSNWSHLYQEGLFVALAKWQNTGNNNAEASFQLSCKSRRQRTDLDIDAMSDENATSRCFNTRDNQRATEICLHALLFYIMGHGKRGLD